jgi:hypothetical protein
MMRNTTLAKGAYAAFELMIRERVQKGLSRSRAIDSILADPDMRRIFDAAKEAHGGDLYKLGGGDWPSGTPHGASSSDPEHPHTESEHHEGGAEALDRYRRERQAKSLHKFTQAVEAEMTKDGCSRSEAMDRVMRKNPELWSEACGRG